MAARKRRMGFSEGASEYQAAPRRHSGPVTLADNTVLYALRVGPKGRVLLPVELRAAMGLAEGDLIVGALKNGVLRLESQRRAIQNIQKDMRKRVGDKSLVDELIAERRAAAARGE